MSKTTPNKSKNKAKRLSPTLTVAIVVAIIGCLGTIFAAIVTGAFAYVSSNGLPDIASSDNSQSDNWREIVSITHNSACPALDYPEALFAGADELSWIEQNAPQYHSVDKLMYAPFLGSTSSNYGNELEINLKINSIVDTSDWIQLSKDASVSIRRIDDAPSKSVIVENSECGGGGYFRYFSPVSLRSDYDRYETDTFSTDADFYTLQPGEPEIFAFTFKCEAPGIYLIEINIPYSFQEEDGIISFPDIRGIACPETANYYKAGIIAGVDSAIILDVSNYVWNGSGYEKENP